jgi:hypothetical protein
MCGPHLLRRFTNPPRQLAPSWTEAMRDRGGREGAVSRDEISYRYVRLVWSAGPRVWLRRSVLRPFGKLGKLAVSGVVNWQNCSGTNSLGSVSGVSGHES